MPMAVANNSTSSAQVDRDNSDRLRAIRARLDDLDTIESGVKALQALAGLLHFTLSNEAALPHDNADGISTLFEAQFEAIVRSHGSLRAEFEQAWKAENEMRHETMQEERARNIRAMLYEASVPKDRPAEPLQTEAVVQSLMQQADLDKVCERYSIPEETLREVLQTMVENKRDADDDEEKKMKSVPISFRLPPDTKTALEKAAKEHTRSVSSMLEKLVTDFLKEKGYLPENS